MLKIGSHVSFSKKGLLNAAEEAISYGSTAFMVYTGAPQNTKRKPMEEQFVKEGLELALSHGIEDIVVHAPYIINLASAKKDTFELAVRFLKEEIERAEYIGVKNLVLHPGSYVDKDNQYGINRIAEGLNEVLHEGQKVNIALETMAGKGSEVGRSFEDLAKIIDKVKLNEKLTICFDTCHTHDAGYNIIEDFDGVMEQFDAILGLDRLALFHINDSKNFRGERKDRHAPLGCGLIGFDALDYIVHHEVARNKPVILETPWIGRHKNQSYPMYEVEIALLKHQPEDRFGSAFLEDVERIDHTFAALEIQRKEFVINTWKLLKDKNAKKADPREPLDRLFDIIQEKNLFPERSDEEIHKRIIAWLSGLHKIL